MPDFAAWGDDDQERALDAWARIEDQPTTITIQRGSATLTAQTVRIEFSDGAREDVGLREGLNVVPGVQRAIVFGVRGHPTVVDTDIERGDRFVIALSVFEVIGVIVPAGRGFAAGEVEAICEARV